VRFVRHDEVPLRRRKRFLYLLVTGEVVQPADRERLLGERVAPHGRLDLLAGDDLERQPELPPELILPLLDEATRTHDHAPLQVSAGDKLLDEQPRHDRLARARVVRQQEAQRLAAQHPLVDGGDLVWIRVHERGMHCEQRVKEVSRADPACLRRQPEPRPVPVEPPTAILPRDLQVRLVRPEQQPLPYAAGGVFEDHLHGPVPARLDALQRDRSVGRSALNEHACLQLFEPHNPIFQAAGNKTHKRKYISTIHRRRTDSR